MKSLGFYEAVAQLIPLLLVLVAIESRVFRDAAMSPGNLVLAIAASFLMLSAITGEVSCLRTLQTEDPSRPGAILAWISLLNITLFIVLLWLLGLRDGLRRRELDRLRETAAAAAEQYKHDRPG